MFPTLPSLRNITVSQKFFIGTISWLTKIIAFPRFLNDIIVSKHFFWKLRSPTANTSSKINTSGSTRTDVANASLICIPAEKFLIFVSANFSSSANLIISSTLFEISSFLKPSNILLWKILVIAVNSGWNPSPRAKTGIILPFTSTEQESGE